MSRLRTVIALAAGVALAACSSESSTTAGDERPVGTPPDITFFNAAHLVPGDGSAVIDDAIFVVNAGKLQHVGKKGDFPAPKGAGRTDLKEQTGSPAASVMPALINVSGFPGLSLGQKFGAENYKE